jgi:hypothetical protein
MASTSTGTTPKESHQDQTKEKKSMKTSSENTTTTTSLGTKVGQGVMNINVEEVNEENICSSDGFTTPKGKIFRIPKVDYEDCPPAPMQRKSMLDCQPSKEVFTSPEIDELFLSTIKQVLTL